MDALWPALFLSLKVACWATIINLVLGVGTGYLLARARFPGRDVLDTLLTLPMVTVFHAVRRIEELQLGRHGSHAAGGDAIEFYQRCVADQVGNALGDGHSLILPGYKRVKLDSAYNI